MPNARLGLENNSKNPEYTYGGFAAVTAANIGWGISDVCIAIVGRGQVITWIHGITGALFLLGIALITKVKLNGKDFLTSFPIGLQRTIVWSAVFIAFQEDNPAIAITVLSFALVLSIIVFGPKLGEKITPFILVLSFIGFIGLLLTSLSDFNSFEFSRGAWLSMLVLPVAAAGTYVLRNVQKSVPANSLPLYMYIWIGLLLSPVMFFVNPQFGFSNYEVFIIVVLAVFGAGGHFLFNYSQKSTSFQFNSIASTIHTPATAIFTWLFIGGTLKTHQILGMVIVTVVVAYMSLHTKRKKVQELEQNLSPDI